MDIVALLGWQFGLQNIRKTSMGKKIAELANEGNEGAQQACENHPEFFEVKELIIKDNIEPQSEGIGPFFDSVAEAMQSTPKQRIEWSKEFERRFQEMKKKASKHTAIFFDDMKEDAQKRLIEEEFLQTYDADILLVTFSIENDLYGYDENPAKQTLEQHIHALVVMNDEEHSWLMVWNCLDHEFNTIMQEDQKL